MSGVSPAARDQSPRPALDVRRNLDSSMDEK
jgi:hypothetical protein